MNIIASFDRSLNVELALSSLEEIGVSRQQILAIPLQQRTKKPQLLDTVYSSDGRSFFDLGMVMAVIGSVLASSYGFVSAWGPVIWGLIGAVGGFLIGFLINWLNFKRKSTFHSDSQHQQTQKPSQWMTETFILIECDNTTTSAIEQLLWEHHALGIALVPGP